MYKRRKYGNYLHDMIQELEGNGKERSEEIKIKIK